MSESDVDTERVTVRTYLPAYQREEWDDHAEDLGMSRSEFVRTMVQAGRRGFDPDPEQPGSDGPNPGGNGLEDRVLAALREGDSLDWDELLGELTDGVEDRLEETLDELQRDDLVRYNPRDGGYVLVEGSP